MTRPTRWIRLLIAAALVVAACSSATTGSPSPAAPSPAAQITAPSPSAYLPSMAEASPSGSASPSTQEPSTVPSGQATPLPGEPDPHRTPGATNPQVTQETISRTICVSGWTATVRPPSDYTTALKRVQIAEYGYTDVSLAAYEEDHLIPLELGGAPDDPLNLWPEPYSVSLSDGTAVGARVKDQLEDKMKALVCAGDMPLAEAQRDIAMDWVAAWFEIVRGVPEPPRPAESAAASPTLEGTAPATGALDAGLDVSIASLTSPVSRGARATLVATTTAGAACTIVVIYKSGPSSATGLAAATASADGRVAWTWTVGSRTTTGTWPVAVTCSANGSSATASASLVVR